MTGPGADAAAERPPAWQVVRLDDVGSTNDEARRLAGQGAPAFTVVTALSQSQGRGRRSRAWQSPPGNLFASLILRPPVPAATAAELSFVAALAVVETLAALVPDPVAVRAKWPNDVLLDGAKVSGLLLESEAEGSQPVRWLVLGLGVNVLHHPEGTPYPATSLAAKGASLSGPGPVLDGFLERFGVWYRRWSTQGFAPVRGTWLGVAQGRGDIVTVRLDRETVVGRFVDLDADGALVLDTSDGARRRICAGDVYFGAAQPPES